MIDFRPLFLAFFVFFAFCVFYDFYDMRQSVQILPGVRRIWVVNCIDLPKNMVKMASCGLRIPIYSEAEQVPICGEATCRCVSTRSGHSYTEEAKLSFFSSVMLDVERDLAFIVEDVEGHTRLIGADKPPFPVVSASRRTGSPTGTSAAIEYEVSHTSLRTLVDCLFIK